jgi:ABC-type lipoprotein export system ATPase subunit
MTVVLVTHEADIARFARRILNFLDGRIVLDEPNAATEAARHLLRESQPA